MASISANGSRGHHKFTLTVTENSYSVANNTSSVSFSFKISPVQSGWDWDYNSKCVTCTCSINGKSYTKKLYSYNGSSTVTLASGTISVAHNSDGSKSMPYSFSVSDGIGASYTPGSCSASSSLRLTTIPRKSNVTVSASSIGLGSSFTAYTNRASTAFTHTITLSMSGATSITKTGVGASTSITVPTSWASAIGTATSKTATVTCTTYNGSSNLGSSSKNITITVPTSTTYLPKANSITYSPSASTKAIYDKFGDYVAGKTKVDITASFAAGTGASLKNTVLSYNGTNYTGTTSTTLTAKDIDLASNYSWASAYCIDSRSRQSTTKETSLLALSYKNPTVNVFRAYRANADGVEDDKGTNACIEYNFEITALNNKNNKSYQIQYRKKNTTSWLSLSGLPALSNYSQSGTINIANLPSPVVFDSESGYDFRVTLTDYFTSTTMNTSIDTTYVLMDFNNSGYGLAIGKVSERNGFEIATDIILPANGDIYINSPEQEEPIDLFDIVKIDVDTQIPFYKLGWVDPNAIFYDAPINTTIIGYTDVYDAPSKTEGVVITTLPNDIQSEIIGEVMIDGVKWHIKDTSYYGYKYGYLQNDYIDQP